MFIERRKSIGLYEMKRNIPEYTSTHSMSFSKPIPIDWQLWRRIKGNRTISIQ